MTMRVAAAGDDEVRARDCSSSAMVGLTTSLPSMRPTRTRGDRAVERDVREHCSAAEAPIIASTSGSFSLSGESTVAMTCVSQWKPFGKQRADRAVDQAAR